MLGTQAPSEHFSCPVGHMAEHAPLLHACPAWHAVVQLPQWAASLATHALLQLSRPAPQLHVPFWQSWPAAHALPHAPQFCGSVVMVLQAPLQSVWPAAHVLPAGVGVAQLAASIRQPKAKVRRAEDQRGRVVIDLPRR